MKTLYININGETIKSDDNIEVIGSAEDAIMNSFYISLGMAVADGVTGIKYKPLVADFEKAKPDEFKSFSDQWQEVKSLLLGENPSGDYEFTLSSEYLDWLKMNATYSTIYYKKYQNQHQAIVNLNLDELYEDTVDAIHRKVIRFLQANDNYKNYDEFVVNDDAITRRSLLVRAIKEKFENVAFLSFEKWSEGRKQKTSIKSYSYDSVCVGKDNSSSESTHKSGLAARLEAMQKLAEGLQHLNQNQKSNSENEVYHHLLCPNCNSSKLSDDGSGYLQYCCNNCGHKWGDEEDENRFNNKEKSYDTKGTPIRRYFEIYGIIVGDYNGKKIRKIGSPYYDNNEESEYWFTDNSIVKIDSQTDRIIKVSCNDCDESYIPYFYQKRGIKWRKTYSEIKETCQKLGMTILSELVGTEIWESMKWLKVETPQSTRYKCKLQIEFEFDFEELSSIQWEVSE